MDIATRQPPRGLLGRACVLTDVECAQPATPWIMSDDQGWYDFTLFQGFVGYLEFMGEGFVSYVIYLGETLTTSRTLNYPVLSASVESLTALSGILGLELDPALGLLAIRSFDCEGVTAPNVVLSTSGGGQRWYFADGLPSVTAMSTDSEGYGGFANAPPGVTSVDAQAPTGQSISGARSLVVRPGWFSVLYVWPPGVQISPSGAPSPSTPEAR